jgi:hypothetical protein
LKRRSRSSRDRSSHIDISFRSLVFERGNTRRCWCAGPQKRSWQQSHPGARLQKYLAIFRSVRQLLSVLLPDARRCDSGTLSHNQHPLARYALAASPLVARSPHRFLSSAADRRPQSAASQNEGGACEAIPIERSF